MVFGFRYNEEKDQLLKATRGIGFEDIIDALAKDNLLADITNPSLRRPHQRLYVVKIGNYAYAVPYVINHQTKTIFLKTVYPSRALTKKYITGDMQ